MRVQSFRPAPAGRTPNNQPTVASRLKPTRPKLIGAAAGVAIGGSLGAAYSPVAGAVGGALGGLVGAVAGNRLSRWAYSRAARQRNEHNAELARLSLAWSQKNRSSTKPPLGRRFLIAVDKTGEVERRYDGFDSSRDLFALYACEDRDSIRVDVEFAHLRAGAEREALDSQLELTWPGGPEPFLVAQTEGSFSSTHNLLHYQLDKACLRKAGWDGQAPLSLEAKTEVDTIRGQLGRTLSPDTLKNVFRWEGRTIYYVVTDRFAKGEADRPKEVDPQDPERFHGGDWQGVIDRLGELESLGVDCIWLSCPYYNERNFLGMDGYHGYWPFDFEQAEPNFGSREKLQELCEKAHQKDMKVMLDVVVNHTGYNHPWVSDPTKSGWFHREGKIWADHQYAMEHGALAGLPDLAVEKPEVADYVIEVHQQWLETSGADAVRVDAVRHVPESFLRDFNEQLRPTSPDFLSLGEAFWQDGNVVAGYQNRALDSMFDFRLAYAIRRVFASDPGRSEQERLRLAAEVAPHNDQEAARLRASAGGESCRLLSEALAEDLYYDNPRKLSIFVDNHDMIRFMSDCGGDERKLELALAFLYACRGMPTLYYGTENAMEGFFPDNRADYDWSKRSKVRDTLTALTEMRSQSEPLLLGNQKELMVSDECYALARIRPDESVVCCFNNSDEVQKLTLDLSELVLKPSLTNLLTEEVLSSDKDQLEVELEPRGFLFLNGESRVVL